MKPILIQQPACLFIIVLLRVFLLIPILHMKRLQQGNESIEVLLLMGKLAADDLRSDLESEFQRVLAVVEEEVDDGLSEEVLLDIQLLHAGQKHGAGDLLAEDALDEQHSAHTRDGGKAPEALAGGEKPRLAVHAVHRTERCFILDAHLKKGADHIVFV